MDFTESARQVSNTAWLRDDLFSNSRLWLTTLSVVACIILLNSYRNIFRLALPFGFTKPLLTTLSLLGALTYDKVKPVVLKFSFQRNPARSA